MKYLVLLDDLENIVHVVWCGMISDEKLTEWQANEQMLWCACKAYVTGLVLLKLQTPTCIECMVALHEYAESRYDGNP
jgi:hypothetical protein